MEDNLARQQQQRKRERTGAEALPSNDAQDWNVVAPNAVRPTPSVNAESDLSPMARGGDFLTDERAPHRHALWCDDQGRPGTSPHRGASDGSGPYKRIRVTDLSQSPVTIDGNVCKFLFFWLWLITETYISLFLALALFFSPSLSFSRPRSLFLALALFFSPSLSFSRPRSHFLPVPVCIDDGWFRCLFVCLDCDVLLFVCLSRWPSVSLHVYLGLNGNWNGTRCGAANHKPFKSAMTAHASSSSSPASNKRKRYRIGHVGKEEEEDSLSIESDHQAKRRCGAC